MKNTYNFDFKQGEFVMYGGDVAVLTRIDALMLLSLSAVFFTVFCYILSAL